MSLKLNERYPGRFDNPTAGYPQGSFKNRTAPDAKDGSYLEKDWANDKEGFFQSLLSAAGLVANGAVDSVGASQYYSALTTIIGSLAPAPPNASTTVKGIIEIATDPEVQAGADTQRAITPASLKAAYGLGDSTLVTDLNNAATGYFYASPGAANSPGTGIVFGETRGSSGTAAKSQICIDVSTKIVYKRTFSGSWSAWTSIIDSSTQATETVIGAAKVATQVLTNAGVDDTTMVSPKKLEGARPKKSQCTAWVNFNGTGVVAIRDSYNVASITDNGVGLYTATFTTSMANANYSTTITTSTSGSNAPTSGVNTQSVTGVSMRAAGGGGTTADADQVCITVTGGV